MLRILICTAFFLSVCGCGGTNSGKQSGSSNVSSEKRSIGSDLKKMQKLGVAFHNYHDVFREFPTIPGPNSKRHDTLSWRVSILAEWDKNKLFDRFDMGEPWDSPGNQKLIAEGKEYFKLSNGSLICTVQSEEVVKSFREIADGTSNTILAIENPNASGDDWSKAGDLTIDEAIDLVKSLKKEEQLCVLLYDGSVRTISSTEGKGLSDDDILAWFDHKDSRPVDVALFE